MSKFFQGGPIIAYSLYKLICSDFRGGGVRFRPPVPTLDPHMNTDFQCDSLSTCFIDTKKYMTRFLHVL